MARGQIGLHSFLQHGPQADTHFLSGLLTFHIEVVVLSYRAAGVARPCWGNFFFRDAIRYQSLEHLGQIINVIFFLF